MPCEPFRLGNVSGIVCTRGRRSKSPCDVPGCSRPHVALCDYPLTGAKPRSCSKHMCSSHKWPVPGLPDTDYCPAHRKVFESGPPAQGVLAL